ncbi:fatty acid oxidation complex subunit alpha FadJ [Vibrio sp. SS-MA-C1-2]|uniref:fatty acid oxidation complex subunit alpha FadJ n=1 Tax=Vibrio sp. SS-MA-C1-2 TaxID=2908646 RepID=UPI001F2D02FB|nr:fatty acid oxidation complex subunit alpha FadJ [Vibrio sp. SS-MA-C1-2]UJF20173.1 fatty acid oxidation complex subunit alpha FadJ [Vibrio sp. SS-MA-C1-2]
MDKQSAFSLDVADNGIAWLAIDVPNEKMNTLNSAFSDEIKGILAELKASSAIKGLVVHSTKPDNFIAGADINMLAACQTAEEAEQLAKAGQQLFSEFESLPYTTVAAIHGPCLGGGLELALVCNVRVCSDWGKTVLGLPEVQLGLLPGSGGTQRLPRLVGLTNALDMILTGKQIRAKKANRMGLVDSAVPQEILLTVAEQLALKKAPKRSLEFKDWMMGGNPLGRSVVFDQVTKQAQKKARNNYPAINAILHSIKVGLESGIKSGLETEAKQFGELVMSSESKALRSIFFATTEMKKESGSDAKPQPFSHIGVLGGGLMGAGISHVTINKAKLPVRLKDISEEGIKNSLAYNYKLFKQRQKRRIITKAELQKGMLRLTGTTSFSGYKNRDIVIEAVFEDLNLKHQMVRDIEDNCSSSTIFATNTSSLPIHKIAEGAKNPENIVGLHYFSPADKMPLVEVIPHDKTSQQTIATVVDLAKKQGKTPIVVADKAGFYVNRILTPYMNEAARCLLAGEPVEHIDNALVNAGFPVGPINLLDEVGVDIAAKITPILVNELGERFQGPALFDLLLKDERKGRKSGKGFYDYKAKGKEKSVDKSAYKLLNITPNKQLTEEEITQRCLLQMLNEAVLSLDEGVIRSPRDGDIGAIFGIGFPPFLGGPFRYMDSVGMAEIVKQMEDYQQKFGDHFAPVVKLKEMAEAGEKFYP